MAENPAAAEAAHGAAPAHGETVATVEHGGGAEHAAPKAFGLIDAPAFISLAMLVVIGIILWKKVPSAIGATLDKKIAGIRQQLDEAAQLRAEAEALRAEYESKSAAADAERATLLERARHEPAQRVPS